MDNMDKAISQIEEDILEADKIVLPERTLEKIREQSGLVEAAETLSRDRNLQRTVEQDFVEVDKTTTPQERISGRMGKPIGVNEVPRKRVEAVKSIPQERISVRLCEQSDVIKVTSSQD